VLASAFRRDRQCADWLRRCRSNRANTAARQICDAGAERSFLSSLPRAVRHPEYRRGLVQGFLLLEASTFGGTGGQPFELVHAKQKRKVH
jgi:hypothetical protein